MRPAVLAATTAAVPRTSDVATRDAVDEALRQLVQTEGYRRDADKVRRAWITIATHRLIDQQRCGPMPAARHNDPPAAR